MSTDTTEDWSEDEIERLRASLNDDDPDKLRLDKLPATLADKQRAIAKTVAETVAIKDRAVDAFRARRAARLAGPNAVLWRGIYGEPQPKTRKRKPTLSGVVRLAAKAGVEVAAYEVRSDGIKVTPGKPREATMSDDNDTTSIDKSEWN